MNRLYEYLIRFCLKTTGTVSRCVPATRYCSCALLLLGREAQRRIDPAVVCTRSDQNQWISSEQLAAVHCTAIFYTRNNTHAVAEVAVSNKPFRGGHKQNNGAAKGGAAPGPG